MFTRLERRESPQEGSLDPTNQRLPQHYGECTCFLYFCGQFYEGDISTL